MALGAYAPLPIRLGGTATEGITAEQHSRMCADLVAVKRTAPLAYLEIETDSLLSYFAMNGTGIAVADISPSVSGFTVTFKPLWTDAYGVTRPVNIRHAIANHHQSSSSYRTASVDILAPNIVQCRKFNSSGSAVTSGSVALKVW